MVVPVVLSYIFHFPPKYTHAPERIPLIITVKFEKFTFLGKPHRVVILKVTGTSPLRGVRQKSGYPK